MGCVLRASGLISQICSLSFLDPAIGMVLLLRCGLSRLGKKCVMVFQFCRLCIAREWPWLKSTSMHCLSRMLVAFGT